MDDSELRRIAARLNFGDCWEWPGAKDQRGYGQIKVAGKTKRVHRVLYEAVVGPVEDGFELDHLCRNTSCCNPDHLEPVTHRENTQRGMDTKPKQGYCLRGHWKEGRRACRICHNAICNRARTERRRVARVGR